MANPDSAAIEPPVLHDANICLMDNFAKRETTQNLESFGRENPIPPKQIAIVTITFDDSAPTKEGPIIAEVAMSETVAEPRDALRRADSKNPVTIKEKSILIILSTRKAPIFHFDLRYNHKLHPHLLLTLSSRQILLPLISSRLLS